MWLFGAWRGPCGILFFLPVIALLAVLALAHFRLVSLLVALCSCYIIPLDFAEVLFVWSTAPVACD